MSPGDPLNIVFSFLRFWRIFCLYTTISTRKLAIPISTFAGLFWNLFPPNPNPQHHPITIYGTVPGSPAHADNTRQLRVLRVLC